MGKSVVICTCNGIVLSNKRIELLFIHTTWMNLKIIIQIEKAKQNRDGNVWFLCI